jgi:asparagine synthase (glutamine-hydrolysing)
MSFGNGRYTIVFNGEIYNYRELRQGLAAQGQKFTSSSDTEALLALYAQRGAGMLDSLRGMFALAIWDEREKELFLARDHFGIKPLYYSRQGGYFRFASQVKALLAGGALPHDEDQAGRAGFYLLGYVPEPHTLYKNIRALPAGCAKLIERSGREKSIRHFDIGSELAKTEAAISGGHNNRLNKDELHDALRDSIKHHMVSDVPVGVFLSSGVDSSVIAALASEQTAHLRTVTLGFAEYKGRENDEVPLAELTAAKLKTDHNTRWVSRGDFSGQLKKILSAMDQPSIDGVNTFFVSKIASELGLKVALSGLGGDELCAGYPSYRQVPRMVDYFKGWENHKLLAVNIRKLLSPVLNYFTSPKYAGLPEYGWSYGGAYLLRRGLFMPWELPGKMGIEQAKVGWEELNLLERLEETVRSLKSHRLKLTALEMTWYMRNQLLRDSDWAGMTHSLEIRVPWVDVKLFRSLVPFLLRGQLNKADLLSAVRSSLPAEVFHRKKTGFSVPVRDWLLSETPNSSKARGLRDWDLHIEKVLKIERI